LGPSERKKANRNWGVDTTPGKNATKKGLGNYTRGKTPLETPILNTGLKYKLGRAGGRGGFFSPARLPRKVGHATASQKNQAPKKKGRAKKKKHHATKSPTIGGCQ